MSTDTPRTDAQVRRMIEAGHSAEGLEYWARDLERELTAAQAEIARLQSGGCARDQRTTQFCAESVALQEKNAKLQERIKALEDVLRRMLATDGGDGTWSATRFYDARQDAVALMKEAAR